ncbi:hypothetical protein PYCCODRAFT_1306793 [Trametes coccinea BRFM310]|uniref:Uncharacterized protein n=1 Tax=Trametes coccinea (strain BRFM310) TaxID=1353009 RepID=A0A1Y2I5R7_TRAC3|nr:hypothetical protein PYCCODRAFT_1306793 [Trametes coccinea BRFM310]
MNSIQASYITITLANIAPIVLVLLLRLLSLGIVQARLFMPGHRVVPASVRAPLEWALDVLHLEVHVAEVLEERLQRPIPRLPPRRCLPTALPLADERALHPMHHARVVQVNQRVAPCLGARHRIVTTIPGTHHKALRCWRRATPPLDWRAGFDLHSGSLPFPRRLRGQGALDGGRSNGGSGGKDGG